VKDQQPPRYFHLHLVSDATGETLNAVAKATSAQYEGIHPIQHVHPLVRSQRQIERVLSEIEASPGIVLFTIVNEELRLRFETALKDLGIPYLAVLDPVLSLMGDYLGAEQIHKPGRQHSMDAEYFRRIDALNYTMAHDDGQHPEDLAEADIILVGVSRTSKTPTCIYLANRGIKAANVPLVPGNMEVPLPAHLNGPLIVGLTASPERLVQIRRHRLRALNEADLPDYADLDAVRDEIVAARKLYARHGWPSIDVTRRSVEETAAAILNLYQHREVS
jgi:regulator of PEP synthase PpsR (kinase-PPPase family)